MQLWASRCGDLAFTGRALHEIKVDTRGDPSLADDLQDATQVEDVSAVEFDAGGLIKSVSEA